MGEGVKVHILGMDFTIKGDKDPEHYRRVAEHVDRLMQGTAKSAPLVSTAKIAILVALRLADELMELRERSASRRLADEDLARLEALAAEVEDALARSRG